MNSQSTNISKARLWTSRVMAVLVILFMLFDSIFKFFPNKEAIEGTLELGFSMHHLPILGALGFISNVLYTIPRTSVFGAVLLTGYFGGAIATHVRMDNPLFSHTLFPVYLTILAWGALWLRVDLLRQLFPVRR
ncbi:MAG: DoxX family protein [Cyclobacteriaceae bacterium]|nr:DoxX family protein [Cyclobacteriaceae bacterium]